MEINLNLKDKLKKLYPDYLSESSEIQQVQGLWKFKQYYPEECNIPPECRVDVLGFKYLFQDLA